MTPEELELQKFKIEAETKRIEIRASIWKIAIGTGLVGIAAAFFPFLQQYSTEYFAEKIAIMKHEAELRIQEKEGNIKNTKFNRDFLASIGSEGRSKDINDRIILAEYYFYLSDQEEERNRWQKFLTHLNELRDKQREAEIKAAKVASSQTSSAEEIAVAKTEARLLRESSLVDRNSNAAIYSEVEPEIDGLLELFSSDDSSIRRKARSTLANRGIEIVRPVMIELTLEDLDYRTRLGLLVSLTEMMRKNKANRKKIIEMLKPQDIETLLILAADDDRTTRIYAAEFLFDLGDPRLFNIILSKWDKVNNDNGKYNFALILKGLAPYISKEQTTEALKSLRSLKGTVGPKTDALLNDAIDAVQ